MMEFHGVVLDSPSQAFLGALIGGAVSLVGGLLGKSSAEKKDKAAAKAAAEQNAANQEAAKVPMIVNSSNTTTQESSEDSVVNVKQMMADAESSGFNPYTFLMSGALANYTTRKGSVTTTTDGVTVTTGHNAMAAAQKEVAIPTAPSFGEVVGNAFGAGANAYLNQKQQEQNQLFQLQLQDRALAGVNKANAAGGRSFYTPSVQTAGSKTVVPSGVTGAPTTVVAGDATVTNPWSWWHVDPNQRNGEDYETRYADFLGGVLGGVLPPINDAAYNGARGMKYIQDSIDRARAAYNKTSAGKAAAANLDNFNGIGGW